jgi:uncharacterized protein (DUF2235 family)
MARNILVFSDGTGQAGGLRPDQRLSNVYKLYRATRIGPDNIIDPAQQIAFYDSGLGSDDIQGPIWGQLLKVTRKFLSSAFGTGFTRNVADCYEHILSVYEPGDKIFLIGFSRGAYTIRSVAGVMNLCGVPVKDEQQRPIPRRGRALRKIVDEAVHTVYEHGAGRPRADFEDEREEQARRFRIKYGIQDDPVANNRGDVPPFFIGAFDTVAALGSTGPKRVLMISGALLVAAVLVAAASCLLWVVSAWPVWFDFLAVIVVALVAFGIHTYRTRVKEIRNFPKPGETHWHLAGWKFQHYDRFLDPRVTYARHAQAIDETRADFARVGWGKTADQEKASDDWLLQQWFAGDHSDIGGSYPETESRLSDIALKWMAQEIEKAGAIIDWNKLHVFPDPAGMQHCEVTAARDLYPNWVPRCLRFSWAEAIRPDVSYKNCDESVLTRLDLPAISKCGMQRPYRPEALRHIPEFARYYTEPAEEEDHPSLKSCLRALLSFLSRGATLARDRILGPYQFVHRVAEAIYRRALFLAQNYLRVK